MARGQRAMIITHSCRSLSNDDRRAMWAASYYGAAYHRTGDSDAAAADPYGSRPNSPRAARGSDDAALFDEYCRAECATGRWCETYPHMGD